MKIVRTINTKPNAKGVEKSTVLTMDFDGISTEALQAGFMAYAVVRLQGIWRKNGIPATVQARAVDLAPGNRVVGPVTAEGQFALYQAMSPEEKARYEKMIGVKR